ncbi:hypothetical protein V1524DRAFT_443877 [Lipomyces starkeyi]
MRLESHWRILKIDCASRFTRPRLDVLTSIICAGLVRSRIHFHAQRIFAEMDHIRIRSRLARIIFEDFIHKF